MITTFVFKIYPKIYIDTIDTYMYLLSCPVTCGHFLRPFPLQGTLYQCSFYWHWHDCLYWHQSQFTILCNNQTPNQILHLYSDRYQQPKLRLKLVWIQNQGKQGSMLRLLSHQCWSVFWVFKVVHGYFQYLQILDFTTATPNLYDLDNMKINKTKNLLGPVLLCSCLTYSLHVMKCTVLAMIWFCSDIVLHCC